MHNPLSGGPGDFLTGIHTPSSCSSYYGAAAAVLVCPEYFISPVPSTCLRDEHSPIRHLEMHPMGDSQLHTGPTECID
jgi:hypothetical protein